MVEPERTRSPAYLALRASARRVLRLVEAEIARQGSGVATIYTDQFGLCGKSSGLSAGARQDSRAWPGRDHETAEAVCLPAI